MTSPERLFLLSTCIVAGACSDDGLPIGDSLGTTGAAGTTTDEGFDSLTSSSGGNTATSPSTTNATSSDGTSGAPMTSSGSSEGSGGSSDATVGSTGEPTGSSGTTEGTTEDSSSGSSSSSGDVDVTTCEVFGDFYADCFGGPYHDMVEDAATLNCEMAFATYYAYSDECGMLQDDLWVCLVTLQCIELGSVGSGSDCDDEWTAGMDACS